MKYLSRIFILVILMSCISFTATRKKVFVIGDSISIFYGPYLKNNLEGKFEYDRKRDKGEAMLDLNNPVGANGGDSRMVLNYLKELQLDKSFHTDILLLNCGLHDIKIDPKTGKAQITPREYGKNLASIYKISRKMKIKLVWVNCTPVNDSIHNSHSVGFRRYNKDAIIYNAIADSIFSKKKVPVIDLYSFSKKFPVNAYADHVHYRPEYMKLQAAFIAGFLLNSKL